jgi:cell division transport system permease protein
MARRFAYYLRETSQAIRRNALIAFAAISTAFIALFLLGFALLVRQEVNLLVAQTEANVEVSVYLEDTISEPARAALQEQIQNMPEVASVRYESKQEAYDRFQKIFANQPALVKNVSPDALPASFRVDLKDAKQFGVVRSRLQGQPGIKDIVDSRDVYNRLLAVTGVFRVGGIVVAFVMLISAAALIGNTVRMAVFDRRTEIGIMRRVGATNWTIRVPFLVEGLIEGLLGAGVAVAALFIMNRIFVDPLRGTIGFLALISTHDIILTIPVILGVAMLISVVASFIATSRFLEV